MDNPQLTAFVAEVVPPLTGALARTCGDPGLAREAAEEATVTALTRWNHVAGTAAPIGWCYLRGLEELRAAGIDLPEDDRAVLAADDVPAAARRVDELRAPTDPGTVAVDAGAVVERARRRRSVQTLLGLVVALGGVVALALLLNWLQSPAI